MPRLFFVGLHSRQSMIAGSSAAGSVSRGDGSHLPVAELVTLARS
jgi:hypothetical protein